MSDSQSRDAIPAWMEATTPIGERMPVKRLRELRGMRSVDLASRTGAALSTILNIEAGRQSPRMELAQKIADALGVSIDAIDWSKAEGKPN